VVAYERGLAEDGALRAALRRNLFGTVRPGEEPLAAAALYARRQMAALAAQPLAELLAGAVAFAPVEAT
jgi:hypothetical protein